MNEDTNPFDGERFARGRYRYGETTQEIEVIRYPFDYYVEHLEPEAREGLIGHTPNAEGYLFYLVPTEAGPLPQIFQSAEAAKAWADSQSWGPVTWEQNSPMPD